MTGIFLLVLGLARAGAAIRFVPYPVIGGFLGATGWLMISGAVRVITDERLAFSNLETLLGACDPGKARCGVCLGARSLSCPAVAPATAPMRYPASCSPERSPLISASP